MTTVKCISPIDGSVYAERETLSNDAALEAVARARRAQKAWAARPLQERVDLVMGALKESLKEAGGKSSAKKKAPRKKAS